MGLDEWEFDLAYDLANGPGTPSLLTLASCGSPAASRKIIQIAQRLVGKSGWPLYELVAGQVAAGPLREEGFLILKDVRRPVPEAVPALVAAHQHLITRSLPVGLLVVGSVSGIRDLRRHPVMGFLSRAYPVDLA
ncbi:hypothetical protein H4V95_001233 [Arthrobacter sp. CAN_C5]|nr:hypothetical protein [Arthrobacter sp. CAN_C5]